MDMNDDMLIWVIRRLQFFSSSNVEQILKYKQMLLPPQLLRFGARL